MKSTNEQLKKRGFVFEKDFQEFKKYKEHELLELLRDKNAYKRTIAVRLLSQNPKEEYILLFCEMLQSGEKLYTKLELQKSLKNYGEKSIPFLMPLLGTIGNNQHKKAELIDLDKKSYPCPRDIIAMILIRIGPVVFPSLETLLAEDTNKNKIHEAIDIIGHITWNFKDYRMENVLLKYYDKHNDDEFIRWKLVRAFQSFHSDEIKKLLENIMRTEKNEIIIEEAKRSLNRIESRTLFNDS